MDEEADKIYRKDVSTRFYNKIAVQKITDEISVDRIEKSPIRSPQRPMSPLKTNR